MRWLVHTLPFSLALTACGFTPEPAASVPDPTPTTEAAPDQSVDTTPKTLRDALALQPMGIALIPGSGPVTVTVGWNGQTNQATIASKSGHAALRVDDQGAIVMDLVTVDFADLVISADQAPPNGIHLTDVHATLTCDPFTTQWMDGDTASFKGTSALHVEWKLVSDQGVLPIRPIDASAIHVNGHVQVDNLTTVSTSLSGIASGQFVSWADLLSLSDLTFELHFAAPNHPAK
jgi:hypothetical protein